MPNKYINMKEEEITIVRRLFDIEIVIKILIILRTLILLDTMRTRQKMIILLKLFK